MAGVAVGDGVAVRAGVAVCEAVAVSVGVAVDESVDVAVAADAPVSRVSVGVTVVAEPDDVPVGVPAGVPVGVPAGVPSSPSEQPATPTATTAPHAARTCRRVFVEVCSLSQYVSNTCITGRYVDEI